MELGEWIRGWIIENLNNRGSDNRGSTVHMYLNIVFNLSWGGHGGRVVTLSPPTSEAGFRFSARPQVGKLVVACCWSAVYSTEP